MSFIRILDLDTNLIAEIDNYKSIIFERSFFSSGLFTIVVNKNILYADELLKNRLITIGNSNEKVGIIKYVDHVTDQNEELIKVRGYELKGIFKTRITIPSSGQSHQSFSSEKTETIIKDIVQRNCIDLTQYAFDRLNITTDQTRGISQNVNTRYKNLQDEVEVIGRVGSLGTKLTLNYTTNEWDFDAVEGEDLTSGGAATNPVVFSTDYDNIKEQQYIDSDLDSFNFAVIGGQGEGVSRTIETTGSSDTDVELLVTFVDARDLSTSASLIARGSETLEESAPIQSFNCKILKESNYEYEVDYDIGDIVTLKYSFLNLTVDKRIEKITEYYTTKGFNLDISFGKEMKTLRNILDNINNKDAIQ